LFLLEYLEIFRVHKKTIFVNKKRNGVFAHHPKQEVDEE